MKKNNPKTNNPNLITIHKNMQGAKAQESHSSINRFYIYR